MAKKQQPSASALKTPRPASASKAGPGKWKFFWLGAIVIFAATIIAYSPLRTADFIWDDDIMLTANPLMQTVDGLGKIWFSTEPHDYLPLTYSSLWIEWRIWGSNAGGYLIVNVLLHALGAVLLWQVLKKLTIRAAWLIGLLFALHPVAVASVGWVAERKNTLSLVFYLAAILFYLRSDDNKRSYGWALVSFALALLSKASVVMFPMVLLGIAWWRRNQIARRDLVQAAPFFALSFVFGLITVWFQLNRSIGSSGFELYPDNMLVRVLGGSWGLWFYLSKALVPIHLSMIYPRWEIDPGSITAWLPALLWAGTLALCWFQRGTWGKAAFFALAYFTLTLLPVLGFFNMFYLVHSRVADHWQYLALIGPITLVVGGAACLLAHKGKGAESMLQISAALVAAAFGVLTWQQATIHSNPEKLWRETIRQNPRAWAAYNNLGRLFAIAGDFTQAADAFEQSVRLKPNSPQALHNLGKALLGKGQPAQAVAHLQESVRLNPYHFDAQSDLVTALDQIGRSDEAIACCRELVRQDPRSAPAQSLLGAMLGKAGKYDEAIEHSLEAARLKPDLFEAVFNVGYACAKAGRNEDAKKYLFEALALSPNDNSVHGKLAEVFQKEGNQAKANFHLARVHYIRGRSLLEREENATAKTEFEQTIALDPSFADAHYQLGALLLAEGKKTEAAEQFKETLRLDPNHSNAGAR